MKTELLPCPFCGITPTLVPEKHPLSEEDLYVIQCANVGCDMQCSRTYLDTYDKVVAAWNTRKHPVLKKCCTEPTPPVEFITPPPIFYFPLIVLFVVFLSTLYFFWSHQTRG